MSKIFPAIIFFFLFLMSTTGAQEIFKKSSVLYPPEMVEKARKNAESNPWAAEVKKGIVAAAEPWLKYSDDELWSMMFGNTLHRSWMVWSNGHCPSCKKDVPMYTWEIDALNRPWKVRCPHCKELFPKNDFRPYYRSGLDEHGVFDPKRADRNLLYNADHPNTGDALRSFGVDDGGGYFDGANRWWFIATYLVYGQWKQVVQGGIRKLADAYVMTGDRKYAHKAGVLLDRVADVYPTFDFGKEGVMYEGKAYLGYVSTWHDACEETRELAIAYDQIYDGIKDDRELVSFLSRKAKEFKLENGKETFAKIQENIENGILRDAIVNRQKIHSNYPRTEVAVALMHIVLDLPNTEVAVKAIVDNMVTRTVQVDGVTGEKGLAAYSSYVLTGFAEFLELYSRVRPNFLENLFTQYSDLRKTFLFHIDTWFNGEYYPNIGDSGALALKNEHYVGMRVAKNPGTGPSLFSLLHRLYKLTGNPAYVQVLYRENGNTADNLPYDLFHGDPKTFRDEIGKALAENGKEITAGSVNFEQWRLAMMRTGKGENARGFWVDYDSGGAHSHADALNMGLYAKGLDLMSDFGYPPVQYGGWDSPRSRWYGMTAAHNTVVVDGKNQKSANPPIGGKTTLWADGGILRAIRVNAPAVNDTKQYERTLAMVNISDRDSYIIDVFRTVGGKDHSRFIHTAYGQLELTGLNPVSSADYGQGTQMRNIRTDASPKPGWRADWKIEDRTGYLPAGSDIHVRYTDLTSGARVSSAEGWLAPRSFNETGDSWIPRLIIQKSAPAEPLASTFAGVIEPYGKSSNIRSIRRLKISTPKGTEYPDNTVAIEITLADGSRDIFISADPENPLNLTPSFAESGVMVQKDHRMETDCELCYVRKSPSGKVTNIAISGGSYIRGTGFGLELKRKAEFFEISSTGGKIEILSGAKTDVKRIY
ncbi:MAG: heparinase II/III domain-containing protein [Candidatus Latescibacterota bacterium]